MFPKFAFIIPYREREEHKMFFDVYMKYLLEDLSEDDYEILFVHQKNELPFNRGAMKNIGFLYLKDKYPDEYESIILIFNDIDTLPYKKGLLDYTVEFGEIKHFYGYKFALGGIFSIRARDFERLNGFPNFWGWGFEDNVIYRRATNNNISVNRDNFFTIGTHKILHFVDSLSKVMDGRILNNEFDKTYRENDGLDFLKELKYEYNDETDMIDVEAFQSKYKPDANSRVVHHMKDGSKIFKKVRRPTPMKMMYLR